LSAESASAIGNPCCSTLRLKPSRRDAPVEGAGGSARTRHQLSGEPVQYRGKHTEELQDHGFPSAIPVYNCGAAGGFMRVSRVAVLVLFAVAIAIIHTRAQQPAASYLSALHWRNVGPPRSGYVSVPAGVPGDSTTYYAGMPEGGVWKTTNGGNTWKPVFDDTRVASVGAGAVAPSGPDTGYVGTGDSSGRSVSTGDGLWQSAEW